MKGIGEKVLGLFVVTEEDAPAPKPVVAPKKPVVVIPPGEPHDASAFAQVYRAGGVAEEDRERLAKVVSLVESLPSEAPFEVKRTIVSASLAAFGVPIDGVLAAGNGALAALDAHVENGRRRTEEVLAQGEARIAKLAAEIEEVRHLMDMQTASQKELVRATGAEKTRVRAAVDFFVAKKNPS
jgi:hypothetical protein